MQNNISLIVTDQSHFESIVKLIESVRFITEAEDAFAISDVRPYSLGLSQRAGLESILKTHKRVILTFIKRKNQLCAVFTNPDNDEFAGQVLL